jgi:hypothetical protein
MSNSNNKVKVLERWGKISAVFPLVFCMFVENWAPVKFSDAIQTFWEVLVTFESFIWQKKVSCRARGPINAPGRVRVFWYVRLGKIRLSWVRLSWTILR